MNFLKYLEKKTYSLLESNSNPNDSSIKYFYDMKIIYPFSDINPEMKIEKSGGYYKINEVRLIPRDGIDVFYYDKIDENEEEDENPKISGKQLYIRINNIFYPIIKDSIRIGGRKQKLEVNEDNSITYNGERYGMKENSIRVGNIYIKVNSSMSSVPDRSEASAEEVEMAPEEPTE